MNKYLITNWRVFRAFFFVLLFDCIWSIRNGTKRRQWTTHVHNQKQANEKFGQMEWQKQISRRAEYNNEKKI